MRRVYERSRKHIIGSYVSTKKSVQKRKSTNEKENIWDPSVYVASSQSERKYVHDHP